MKTWMLIVAAHLLICAKTAWSEPATGAANIDAAERAVLESPLWDPQAGWIQGIWPPDAILRKAKPCNDALGVATFDKEWFGRVLRESVQPEKGEWNSKQWLIARRLRWETDWVVGRFASRDPRIVGIEFQQGDFTDFTITIVSPEMFPNRKFDGKEVLGKLDEIFNIPADCLPHLEVHLRHLAVDKTDILVTYGNVLDARYVDPGATLPADPPSIEQEIPGAPQPAPPTNPTPLKEFRPIIPDNKQEWFSPMGFCIFKGRISLSISTIDYKSDDRPMKSGFHFK